MIIVVLTKVYFVVGTDSEHAEAMIVFTALLHSVCHAIYISKP